jgi:phosphoglycerol transferase MdoB-like AlkP superfamily enzyme
MRERLKIFGYFALFWFCFQLLLRVAFIIYNYSLASTLSAKDLFLVFFNGAKMDLSMTGYVLLLSGLLLAMSVYVKHKYMYRMINTVTIILLLLSGIIAVVDVELYRHWGFRMNTTPLFYMGSEAVGSVSIGVILKLISILVILFSIPLLIYSKTIAKKIKALHPSSHKAALVLVMISAAMFLPIRGSFTVAPMNTGFVYFHLTNTFANHAAINVVWNFMYSLRKGSHLEYPEDFFDKKKTTELFLSLYPKSDSTTSTLFKTKKPNIILFILESFTADVIEPLGGLKGIAPNLSHFAREGILFDNFYASGDRTDKGIISVLSGYPAQPATSIIKYPAKTQHLPHLNHFMNELGYHSSFVYGGDIDFANFRSYITSCQFQHVTTEDDFPSAQNESKWGVHDHIVLDRAFAECDTATSPFFKVILTLSSHEPFDVPMKPRIVGGNDESLFLNSCVYTDSAIGAFVENAKTKSWWDNTVIIFVADHGHRFPGNKQAKDKEKFRIPLIMIGGAVKSDTVIHTYASQTDIANTLLGQLSVPADDFTFSKNILGSNTGSFAAYFFNDGYGFVTPGTYIVYDNAGKQFMQRTGDQHDVDLSKAYQQMLYSDYNKK